MNLHHWKAFKFKFEDETPTLFPVFSRVPQGSVLGPVLYTLFTADLPLDNNTSTATFADDTVIMATSENLVTSSNKLQNNIILLENWLSKWRIKANASKSVQVTFTLRKDSCPPVVLNNNQLPQADHAKYLGIYLEKLETWQKHIFTKRKQLGLKQTSLFWLIGTYSSLALQNKVLIYKAIIKPIWSYGIQLWGTAAKTNIDILQRFQSKILRLIANAPRYVTNATLHQDLNIPTVQEEIQKFSTKYLSRLQSHPNILASDLSHPPSYRRRLKRLLPFDLF